MNLPGAYPLTSNGNSSAHRWLCHAISDDAVAAIWLEKGGEPTAS